MDDRKLSVKIRTCEDTGLLLLQKTTIIYKNGWMTASWSSTKTNLNGWAMESQEISLMGCTGQNQVKRSKTTRL